MNVGETPSMVRYSVSCRWCKQRWTEDHPAEVVRRYAPPVGLVHQCPRHDFTADIARVRAKVAPIQSRRAILIQQEPQKYIPRTDESIFIEEWGNAVAGLGTHFTVKRHHWKTRAGGVMTECGPRCMAATGPNCDCRCRGKNHGRGSVTNIVE